MRIPLSKGWAGLYFPQASITGMNTHWQKKCLWLPSEKAIPESRSALSKPPILPCPGETGILRGDTSVERQEKQPKLSTKEHYHIWMLHTHDGGKRLIHTSGVKVFLLTPDNLMAAASPLWIPRSSGHASYRQHGLKPQIYPTLQEPEPAYTA